MYRYCYNCMKPLDDNTGVCPHCGQVPFGVNPIHQLKAGTLLKDRYLIGKSLGQGGFGITYIGRDTLLNKRVAVKEFYPNGYAYRDHEVTAVITITSSGQTVFRNAKRRFLEEAQTLARFSEESGIVSVQDFFEENNTAYIVMEYLDGITLKRFVEAKGKIPATPLIKVMLPLIRALGKVHEQGIIHRDISPDNIILLRNGSIKLLDFGAAREFGGDHSLSVMLKPGYAPEEQYRSKGKQGPWTDVYALCATMFYCLTGVKPDEAVERMVEDTLHRPSALGADISPSQENVLLRGMAVRAADRYQSMEELAAALIKPPAPNDDLGPPVQPDPPDPSIPPEPVLKPKPHRLIIILCAILATTGLIFGGIKIMRIVGSSPAISEPSPAVIETETPSPAPTTAPKPTPEPTQEPTQKPLTAEEKKYVEAEALLADGRAGVAALEFRSLGSYGDAAERSWDAWKAAVVHNHICGSEKFSLGVRYDGTAYRTGNSLSFDKNVVAVAAGGTHSVYLYSNGRVSASGLNIHGENEVGDWTDIVSITAGEDHTVGLRSDGTVVATGDTSFDRCEVSGWSDIVAVAAGKMHTVGLKSDGTVVATGLNSNGQCNVSEWKNIVAICAGSWHTIGVRADGTCVATGWNENGQCDVSSWSEIVSACGGEWHSVGLKSDGTCVAAGSDRYGETDLNGWTGIVEICAGPHHTLGVRRDGTCVAAGYNEFGMCYVQDWAGIGLGNN